MRYVVSVALASVLACGGGDDPISVESLAGVYVLEALNGNALPGVRSGPTSTEVTAGTLTLRTDGSFSFHSDLTAAAIDFFERYDGPFVVTASGGIRLTPQTLTTGPDNQQTGPAGVVPIDATLIGARITFYFGEIPPDSYVFLR